MESLIDGDFSNLDEINKLIESNPNEMPKVIGLLASKLVGSNQDDIEKALEFLDHIVKACNRPAIFDEINKMTTLNPFIQLLSSEHQDTSKNKEKATRILFDWKHSKIGAVENVSKVYNMLRNRKIIESDPIQNDCEEEERMQLLARLLESKLTQDLEEAKKIIKTVNKMDGLELDKHFDDVIEAAKAKSQLLNNIKKCEEKTLVSGLLSDLASIRATLAHWAVELAEKQQDDKFSEVLTLFDCLNNTIQDYKRRQLQSTGEVEIVEFNEVAPCSPRQEVRFDPECIKLDKSGGIVQRKPTPHSKVTDIDCDYLKLYAAANSKGHSSDIKRLSNGSVNEELDDMDLSPSISPNAS